METNSLHSSRRRIRESLYHVSWAPIITILEPHKPRFHALVRQVRSTAVRRVGTGRGEEPFAQQFVGCPVDGLAHGAAVVWSGCGVADGAEVWEGGGDRLLNGDIVFEEERLAEVLGHGESRCWSIVPKGLCRKSLDG
jgi:hypothetical protein